MPIALSGLFAVIPDPQKFQAVVYAAGLSDPNTLSILRLDDFGDYSYWKKIGDFPHEYMFSGIIPL